MKKVKNIDLVFENCEVCSLTPDMFKCLVIQGIKENIYVNCYQYRDGEIIENKTCNYFAITILEKGLNQKMGFEEIELKTRLKQSNDIVYIDIMYPNGKEERIFVTWNEEDDYENKYQRLNIDEKGTFEITISKDKLTKE